MYDIVVLLTSTNLFGANVIILLDNLGYSDRILKTCPERQNLWWRK